jgi:hypothetical protein
MDSCLRRNDKGGCLVGWEILRLRSGRDKRRRGSSSPGIQHTFYASNLEFIVVSRQGDTLALLEYLALRLRTQGGISPSS